MFFTKNYFDIKNYALVILLYMKFFVQFYGFAYKNYVKKLHDRFNNKLFLIFKDEIHSERKRMKV